MSQLSSLWDLAVRPSQVVNRGREVLPVPSAVPFTDASQAARRVLLMMHLSNLPAYHPLPYPNTCVPILDHPKFSLSIMRVLSPWSLPIRVPLPVGHSHRRLLFLSTSPPTLQSRYSTTTASVTPKTPHDPDPAERYHKTVILPDRRQLAWAEAGSPTGFPCFMFHGFPGSRLEARGLEDIGRRHDIRFICPDRPGYGQSTFQPDRRLLDWPADVQFIARHLDLKRFAVLGGSGGGPHALACAYAIPPDTLSATGLLCSAGPWESGTHDLQWYRRSGSWAAANMPSLSTRVLDGLLGAVKAFAGTNQGKKMLDGIAVKGAAVAGKEIPVSEQTPEAVAARRERLLRIFLEPFAQGTRGFVQEAYILTHPYGFQLEDVRPDRRIIMWHGTDDTNAPIRMVRYMHERLPNSQLHELEGETHFTIMKHLEDVVVQLVAQR